MTTGVQPAEDGLGTGCECKDVEECQYSGCLCLQDQEDDSGDEGHARKKVYMYHMHGAKAGLMRSKFLMSTRPIYECHNSCACAKDCPNRVVERGRQVPLQIFRTKTTGWGVRSPVDIKKGQFIDEYTGEISTIEEALRLRNVSSVAELQDEYSFVLNKFTDVQSPDVRLRGPPLVIDGEFMAGPARFINHSCDPNLRTFALVRGHANRHIHHIALFAIKDIPSGEELSYNYVDGNIEQDNDIRDITKQGDMFECFCSSKNCRGFL